MASTLSVCEMTARSEASQFIWKWLHFRRKYSKKYRECGVYLFSFLKNFLSLLLHLWFLFCCYDCMIGRFFLFFNLASFSRQVPEPQDTQACIAVPGLSPALQSGPSGILQTIQSKCLTACLSKQHYICSPKQRSQSQLLYKQRELSLILLVKINREN